MQSCKSHPVYLFFANAMSVAGIVCVLVIYGEGIGRHLYLRLLFLWQGRVGEGLGVYFPGGHDAWSWASLVVGLADPPSWDCPFFFPLLV